MKKRLKNINKFKLNLNHKHIQSFLNINYQQKDQQQKQLKLFENIHQLEQFAQRAINLLIKTYYFSFLFKMKKKLYILKIFKNFFYFLFFYHINLINQFCNRILKNFLFFLTNSITKKKKFLKILPRFFRFLNIIRVSVKKNNYNFVILLIINNDFQENKVKNKAITKKNFIIKKKVMQFVQLLKFKYFLEINLIKTFFYNFIIIFRLTFYDFSIFDFNQLLNQHQTFFSDNQQKNLKHYDSFHIPSKIRKLEQIKHQFFYTLISGFYYANAQLLIDTIAISLNRIRRHFAFLQFLIRMLKQSSAFAADISLLKLVVCVKINANTRTCFFYQTPFKKKVNSQTFFLKIDYGYSSAETYTGTFGLHLQLYRNMGKLDTFTIPEDFM